MFKLLGYLLIESIAILLALVICYAGTFFNFEILGLRDNQMFIGMLITLFFSALTYYTIYSLCRLDEN